MINNYSNFLGNTWIYLTTVLPYIFFLLNSLLTSYLIAINCTLITPNDELSEQLLDSRAITRLRFHFFFSHKYQIRLQEA